MNRSVLVDRKDGVARVTISRPEVRNALDAATVGELELVLKALETDHTVRCVILRGAGDRVFVSGADVREFRDKLATPEGARAYDEEIERMQAIICSMPKPVIAQIQGFAIGGGCVLAVACDFRIASDKGRFGIPIEIGWWEVTAVRRGPPDPRLFAIPTGRVIVDEYLLIP